MFLGDTHTHSLCSPDGRNTVTEMACAAKTAGLTHLCLTDHCDLVTLQGAPAYTYDWTPYNAAIAAARAELPQGLTLAQGLSWEKPTKTPLPPGPSLPPRHSLILSSAQSITTGP